MKIILASESPRRAALLKQAGIPFCIEKPGIDEDTEVEMPAPKLVLSLARRKAFAVAEKFGKGYIIAADTTVIFGGLTLGKPADLPEAREMLLMLSGKRHKVYTGLVLLNALTGQSESGFAATEVWLKRLNPRHLEAYLASGEPFDKAGAYGIQGQAALFVDRIKGSYSNVVGLPLGLLYDFMIRMDVPLWQSRKDGDYAK